MPINIATWERVLRVVLGGLIAAGGVLVVKETGVFGYRALAIAAVLVGLDLVVTGAIGFCPLYHKLRWGTAPRRTPSQQ